jgi:hypothetical protein
VKKSKIRRLVSKKMARHLAGSCDGNAERLAEHYRREASGTIAKMKAKGYELLTCLESGEGVFVRDDDVVGLHIQLPGVLYERLSDECRRREVTKRSVVVSALEAYFTASSSDAMAGANETTLDAGMPDSGMPDSGRGGAGSTARDIVSGDRPDWT